MTKEYISANFRTATNLDYAHIVQLLTNGDRNVLVRSLLRSEQTPYPLLDISQGPYQVTSEGVQGFTKLGEVCTLRVTDSELKNIELRYNQDTNWIAPEMGSVILLVPK